MACGRHIPSKPINQNGGVPTFQGDDRVLFDLEWGGETVQLTEVEVRREMPPPEMVSLAETQFSRHMNIGGMHGIHHWMSVLENGLALANLTGANRRVVAYFAIFHDCQRRDNYDDPWHGERAARYLEKIRERIPLEDVEFDLLLRACLLHSQTFVDEDDITVLTCLDADRLNLGRPGVEIIPDPAYLQTEAARYERVIAWATERAEGMEYSGLDTDWDEEWD